MRINLQAATVDDVADMVALRAAVNERLTTDFGNGYWVVKLTEKGALFAMRNSSVYLARFRGRLVATLTLATKKPWAIDPKHFAVSKRPLYLMSMAVDPEEQRQGAGRLCVDEALRIARKWPADAIRLDAYDCAAGAGEFYRKCGFQEMGRVTYRNCPLIYFEKLIG